ncbi:MAG: Mur ligase family protein, partial [Patescibacteria group bacterium]
MDKLLNKIKKIIPSSLFKALQPIYHYLLSFFSAFLYRWPSEKIIVIGVTGTTGKTTSAYLIAKALEAAGYKTGFTSTAMFNDGRREWLNDKKMTMVGRLFTQRMLRGMVKNGCRYAVVETTSEGVRQFRHRFINYDILVFTGLYPEHIESHGNFENYKEAKGRLFSHLKKCRTKYCDDKKIIHKATTGLRKTDLNRIKKTTVMNLDDEYASYFSDFWAEEKIGFHNPITNYTPHNTKESNLKVIGFGDIKAGQTGTSFTVFTSALGGGGIGINLHLLGEFNVANA